jgi:hypothetical protein
MEKKGEIQYSLEKGSGEGSRSVMTIDFGDGNDPWTQRCRVVSSK